MEESVTGQFRPLDISDHPTHTFLNQTLQLRPPNSHLPESDPELRLSQLRHSHFRPLPTSRFTPPQFRPLTIQTTPIQTPLDSDYRSPDHSRFRLPQLRLLPIHTTPIQTPNDSDHTNSDPSRFRLPQSRPLPIQTTPIKTLTNSDHPIQTTQFRPLQLRPS